MKSHLLFVGVVMLLLCGLVVAQDYDIFGAEHCDLIIGVVGEGNIEPIHVAISQNDVLMTAFEVVNGERSTYHLPAGLLSWRVSIAASEEDTGHYSISPEHDCPEVFPEQLQMQGYTGSSDDKDAWLLAWYTKVPAQYKGDYITLDFLHELAEGDPMQGYGPGLVIDLVNLLISYDAEEHAAPTPSPTESPEPTAEATQHLN